jgi:hypothetical protein
MSSYSSHVCAASNSSRSCSTGPRRYTRPHSFYCQRYQNVQVHLTSMKRHRRRHPGEVPEWDWAAPGMVPTAADSSVRALVHSRGVLCLGQQEPLILRTGPVSRKVYRNGKGLLRSRKRPPIPEICLTCPNKVHTRHSRVHRDSKQRMITHPAIPLLPQHNSISA